MERASSPEVPPQPPPGAAARLAAPSAERARIVFADDSAAQRRLVASVLGPGYDVTVVADGLAALQAIRKVRPDVILSDLEMPGLNGRELLRIVKADEQLRRVPFLLVSGEEERALETLDAGADDYVAKPYRGDELRARVAAALRSYRMYQALERQHAELVRVHEESRRLEVELRSAQKLEAVGRLAAGIAHEINTPVQFITDNTRFLEGAVKGIVRVLETLRTSLAAHAPEGDAAVAAVEEEVDLAWIVERLPETFAETRGGLERVAGIVRAMKEFAHPDQKAATATDLNRALHATLEVARNEYKYSADVETAFGTLPLVTCHAGDVNQVFLNVIVNAAHATADVMKRTGRRGRIRIETAPEGALVRVSISDTGGGIPAAIRDRIFEPFFTTKEVGRGTGQGLAIARNVVVQHGGTLTFDTVEGDGTTFHVRLPVAAAADGGGA